LPCRVTVPASGVSRPARTCSNVVLPRPFSPTMPMRELGVMVRFTCCSTCLDPRVTSMSSRDKWARECVLNVGSEGIQVPLKSSRKSRKMYLTNGQECVAASPRIDINECRTLVQKLKEKQQLHSHATQSNPRWLSRPVAC